MRWRMGCDWEGKRQREERNKRRKKIKHSTNSFCRKQWSIHFNMYMNSLIINKKKNEKQRRRRQRRRRRTLKKFFLIHNHEAAASNENEGIARKKDRFGKWIYVCLLILMLRLCWSWKSAFSFIRCVVFNRCGLLKVLKNHIKWVKNEPMRSERRRKKRETHTTHENGVLQAKRFWCNNTACL